MSTQALSIDDEIASLIPPLTEDEYTRLEQSIIAEGCREPIVVWNDIIIDGHNRYKICSEHGIAFTTVQKDFKDRNEAMLWIIHNQFGRRNLNTFRRIEMVRNYETAVKAQAKARQGTRNDIKQLSGNFSGMSLPTGRDARDELGNMAGVSGNTYQHAIYVLDNAPASVIEAARNDKISINTAYGLRRIEQGEPAKSVISEIKSRNRKPKTDTPANTSDDVLSQSATSLRNNEANVQHEADTIAMNNEKQPSTPPEAQAQQAETPRQFQQPETINHVVAEAKEHETQLPIDTGNTKETVTPIRNKGSQMAEAQKIIEKWGFKYRDVVFVGLKRMTDSEGKQCFYCYKKSDWTLETCEFCLLATRGNVRRVRNCIP